jgi:hypothetical protein
MNFGRLELTSCHFDIAHTFRHCICLMFVFEIWRACCESYSCGARRPASAAHVLSKQINCRAYAKKHFVEHLFGHSMCTLHGLSMRRVYCAWLLSWIFMASIFSLEGQQDQQPPFLRTSCPSIGCISCADGLQPTECSNQNSSTPQFCYGPICDACESGSGEQEFVLMNGSCGGFSECVERNEAGCSYSVRGKRELNMSPGAADQPSSIRRMAWQIHIAKIRSLDCCSCPGSLTVDNTHSDLSNQGFVQQFLCHCRIVLLHLLFFWGVQDVLPGMASFANWAHH